MSEPKKKQEQPGQIQATTNQEQTNQENKSKIDGIKYAIAWVKWLVDFGGSIFAYIRDNPLPKKADFEHGQTNI